MFDADRKRVVTPSAWFTIKTKATSKKLFINVCTHESIAEPPPLSDDELETLSNDNPQLGNYFVPIILCQPRVDSDQAGKECQAERYARCKRLDADPEKR